jgi:hypothetical protein
MNKIEDLATQLAKLTPAQALNLLSSIEALQAKANEARTLRAQAEAQRDEVLARCTCNCGKPATYGLYGEWRQMGLRPYVDTNEGIGGLESVDSEYADFGPDAESWVDEDLFVHCGERDCKAGWRRVKGGQQNAIKNWV